MKCIFCLVEKDDSKFNVEHVFPESIGGNFTIPNVCTDCNSRLGTKVDAHLTNNYLVEGIRQIHKIPGKGGTVPNPLKNGVLDSDPSQKVQYRFTKDGTPESLYVVQKYEEKNLANGQLQITASGDEKDEIEIFEAVNKKLERMGRPKQTLQDFRKNTIKTSSIQPIQYTAGFNVAELQRSLVKIAYELACHWLGDTYLLDPEGLKLRLYLTDYVDGWENRHTITADLPMGQSPESLRYWEDEENLHIGLMIRAGDRICVILRIFKNFCMRVLVSNQAKNYQVKDRFLSNDYLTGEIRNTEFQEEIARLVREGKFKIS